MMLCVFYGVRTDVLLLHPHYGQTICHRDGNTCRLCAFCNQSFLGVFSKEFYDWFRSSLRLRVLGLLYLVRIFQGTLFNFFPFFASRFKNFREMKIRRFLFISLTSSFQEISVFVIYILIIDK